MKQWIYHGKIKSAKTPGGHHRVPESEIGRLIPKKLERGDIATRRGMFRKISGRNQLIGRVVAITFRGLLAQITLAIVEQHITSIITADAAKEMRLKAWERFVVHLTPGAVRSLQLVPGLRVWLAMKTHSCHVVLP